MPFTVTLRRTKHNGISVSALLAVLEAELAPGLVQTGLARSVEEVDAGGLVVYSFMTAQAPDVHKELAQLRARRGGDLLAIAGGPHPSGDPAGTLAMGFCWVGVGEAGPDFAALVRALARGERPAPGVFRESAPPSLDRYPPWPERGDHYAMLEISRGCPHGCGFCQTPSLHGRKPRHRSIEQLARLLRRSAAAGHSFTRFVAPNAFAYGSDDGRTPNLRALERLVRTAREAGFEEVFLGSFPSEVRPDSVTPEVLALVRELCSNRRIVVGLQSGSPRTLRRIGRGHTVEEGVRAVERIAAAGLEPRVDFIFGLPDETDEDRARTREVIRRVGGLGACINAHLFAPLPGTPLARAAPGRVDPATLELLEELLGRGQCGSLACLRQRQLPSKT
jgi:B12-binding domain/radical SAM domain protein